MELLGCVIAIGAAGMFVGLVAYGLWADPVLPWLRHRCDELRFRADERRLKKQHHLQPMRPVCDELSWYRDFFAVQDPGATRAELEAFFLTVYPMVRQWDREWEAVRVD